MRSSMSPLKHHRKLRQNPDKGGHIAWAEEGEELSSSGQAIYPMHVPLLFPTGSKCLSL